MAVLSVSDVGISFGGLRAVDGISFGVEDCNAACEAAPVICDLKPGGQYLAHHLFEAGGTRLVLNRLMAAGTLTDSPSVSGRSLFEEAREAVEPHGQRVIRSSRRSDADD